MNSKSLLEDSNLTVTLTVKETILSLDSNLIVTLTLKETTLSLSLSPLDTTDEVKQVWSQKDLLLRSYVRSNYSSGNRNRTTDTLLMTTGLCTSYSI